MEGINNQNTELSIEDVPEEIISAIKNDEVARWTFEIGKERGLHIDQTDELKKVVVLALLGTVKGDDLFSQVASRLRITKEDAGRLVSDIDQKVFQELRARMQENDAKDAELEELLADEPELPPPSPVDESLDRESILREVENPTPAVPPAPLVEPVPVPELSAGPSSLPESAPSTASTAPSSTETHLSEQKLSGSFSIPPTERKDADTSIAAVKKTDPYREPI